MKDEFEIFTDIEGVKELMQDCVDKYFHPQETKRRNYQRIEIRTCGDSPVFAQIYIGGQKIEGVRSYQITHKAGDLPRLHLDINAMNLDIDGGFVCTAEGWGDFAMRMIDPYSKEMDGGGVNVGYGFAPNSGHFTGKKGSKMSEENGRQRRRRNTETNTRNEVR